MTVVKIETAYGQVAQTINNYRRSCEEACAIEFRV